MTSFIWYAHNADNTFWGEICYNIFSEDIESDQKKSGKYKKMLNRTISLTQISK